MAVADDQFALAAADGDEGIDGLQAGRHRLVHRFTGDDARCLDVDAGALLGLDRAFAIDGIAQTVNDATEQTFADGNFNDGAGALDGVAFLDGAVVTEDHTADVVGFEVKGHAADTAGEFDHLAGLHLVEAIDAGDAVTDRKHLADFRDLSLLAEILDLILKDRGNLSGADVHQPVPFMATLSCSILVLIELSIMRLPTFTTRPPSRAGSTLAWRVISRPTLALSWSLRACNWASVSG